MTTPSANAGLNAKRCGSRRVFRCGWAWGSVGGRAHHWRCPLDATTLGQRFVVLAISVVSRGCALPVAWVVLPAGAKHAWRREWLRLLRRLRPAIPPGRTVIVMADRGWYAP